MTARTNDLECWKLFCLVVEKQGLNAAADFADIEPSRLSRVINSLEAELGSPLLVHNRRPLQTTSFGDQAYAMAKALLAQHALMLETLKGGKDRMEGLITLAIPAGIGPLFVTPQLLEFQQIFPKIEFELITHLKPKKCSTTIPKKSFMFPSATEFREPATLFPATPEKWNSYPAAHQVILKSTAISSIPPNALYIRASLTRAAREQKRRNCRTAVL